MDKQNIGTLAVRLPGLPDGVIKFGEWRWDRLWHTVSFADGESARREFFIGTQGLNIPGGRRSLTDVDTNVPRAGDNGLPIDWEMFIYSIKIKILRVVGTDDADGPTPLTFDDASTDSDTPNRRILFELDRKVLFEFKFNNKTRNMGRMEDFPAGGGFSYFTTQFAQEYANNGVPSPRDAYALVIPIHLRPNVSFKMIATPVVPLSLSLAQQVNDLPNTTIEPQCQLEGLIKLPVT